MAFNDTKANQKQYDRYYAAMSKYADARLSTGAASSPADRDRLDAMASAIVELAGDASGPVGDVGCGAGGLLTSLAGCGLTDGQKESGCDSREGE
jgi:hypothetical protein